MSEKRWLDRSERWLRLLLRLYPASFRQEMGEGVLETYRDRCRTAFRRGGGRAVVGEWARALADSLKNGPGERVGKLAGSGGALPRELALVGRRLLRAPAFLVTVVATLAVGLGAFAVVWTAVYQVLLAPMPYEEPDELYYVWRDYGAIFDLDRGWLGGTDVAELQKAGGVIEAAAGLELAATTLAGRDGTDPTEIDVMITSPNFFDLLGVQPALGRGFAPAEVGPDAPRVVVLGRDLWTRLGADPGILGQELRLGGDPYTVIGVMPEDFRFMRSASLGPPAGAEAYVPFAEHLAETEPGAGSYAGLLRARDGATPAQVEAAVAAVGEAIDERDFEGAGLSLWSVGLAPDLVASVRPALVVLGTAGGFLVLVLMANLATLLLARAARREQEFAVSRALGARAGVVARSTLMEGGLLGLFGGLLAVLAAGWATRALVALAPADLPRLDRVRVDGSVAVVVVAVGILLGLAAAAVPAVWASRASLASLLASSGVRGGGGHGRMRKGMVVVQVALSLVLLSTGGLVVRSFERLLRADPGFRAEGVLTLRVPIPSQLYPEAVDVLGVHDRIESALRSVPGVTGVGAVSAPPLSADASQSTIAIADAPGNTGDEEHDRPLVDLIGARAGYVEVMGLRLLAGRAFPASVSEGLLEVVVDDVFARHFFPAGPADALGASIPVGEDGAATIVGVVDQARLYDVHQDSRGQLFLRVEDWATDFRDLTWTVGTTGDPEALVSAVRAALRGVDRQLALADVRTMEAVVADALRQQRMSAVLVAGFALGALLLAAMGLFGVVSAAVLRRKHELAMRLVLGADQRSVVRLVLGEGARLVLLGIVLGVPGTYLAGRLIAGALVGVSPADPLTLVTVSVGLALVALAACWLPARRAVRIDPSRSLRQE